jgi:hypothetical protein
MIRTTKQNQTQSRMIGMISEIEKGGTEQNRRNNSETDGRKRQGEDGNQTHTQYLHRLRSMIESGSKMR